MQRYFYRLVFSIIAGSFLLGATARQPEIVNYPKPDLEVDLSAFRRGGCNVDRDGNLNCEWESPVADLGCTTLSQPSDLLGGLNPKFPLAVCKQRSARSRPATGEYIYQTGGLLPTYYRYVVYKNGKFSLIKNEREFKNTFAPIESSQEALSYALAVKNLQAFYGQQINPDYEYFVDKIEDTRVQQNRDGYLINLYEKRIFGCGPHPTSVVNVLVTRDGNVREVSRKEVYKNPQEDFLCVD
ncbi:MAG TPA: hypothetical protein V6D28_06370 [Leptolyngbyaceae cyanobacterium]